MGYLKNLSRRRWAYWLGAGSGLALATHSTAAEPVAAPAATPPVHVVPYVVVPTMPAKTAQTPAPAAPGAVPGRQVKYQTAQTPGAAIDTGSTPAPGADAASRLAQGAAQTPPADAAARLASGQGPSGGAASSSTAPSPSFGGAGGSGGGGAGASAAVGGAGAAVAIGGDPGRAAAASAPAGSAVSGGEAITRATTDAGDLINKSQAALGTAAQKRSPIANEARIRGYRLGQVYTQADGAYWFPARLDLDTFLSKIDSGIIRDVVILKGPYSARYGPGFSFIDIETLTSPRYQNGFDAEGRTVFNYKNNGEQLYARQAIQGGSDNWGFRLSYGHRTGNDYRTGDDVQIPASYNARDVDFVFGYDFSPDSRLEFGYLRLDQTGLEFPGQVFDTRFLVTDGFRMRYTLENQGWVDRLTAEGWFNRTALAGDAQNPGKRRQIPVLDNPLGFSGFTDIDLSSSGYRVYGTWGGRDELQLTVGTDLRWVSGALNEIDNFLATNIPGLMCNFNFAVPRSHLTTTGGMFAEAVAPVSSDFTLKTGARIDLSQADVDQRPGGFCPPGQPDTLPLFLNSLGVRDDDFRRNFTLFLAYATGEYKVNDNVSLQAGLGHAMRAPTTTELYALQPFLATLQQGLTSVIGNPQLDPERLYQMDLGFKADYGWLRGGASLFHSFIQDYITYSVADNTAAGFKLPTSITNALTVRYTNTGLATLSGFEAYSEVDVNDYMTPFVTMSYAEGRDMRRGGRGANIGIPGVGVLGANQEPLPGIPPLETRLGTRFHGAGDNPRWAVEVLARVVDRQDRVASSLLERTSAGFTVWDMRGYWRLSDGVVLTAGIENVFDKNYREHLDLLTGFRPIGPGNTLRGGPGVFQPGFNSYVGLELRY